MNSQLFQTDSSLVLLIDVQEKLWPHIANKDRVAGRCKLLLEGSAALGVPVVVSEQYPKGLGRTIDILKDSQPPNADLFEKVAFGCLGDKELSEYLSKSGRRQLIICGIETHVCVLQTVLEAQSQGYQCAVVADAVGSREESNRQIALNRMKDAGAVIVSTEMILFEWMQTAKHPAFKTISALLK